LNRTQSGILAPLPDLARYVTFTLRADAGAEAVRQCLSKLSAEEELVLGLGLATVGLLGGRIAGLRVFPARVGSGVVIPSTPAALWCWLRGGDRGELLHRNRRLRVDLAPVFRQEQVIDAFMYGGGLDLTGYEDGTENPRGEQAERAAIVQGAGAGMDGSSFVAVQQWVHDLDRFFAQSATDRDHTFGRSKCDNQEIDNAPSSAHIKRVEQEDFQPAAFILRRSMPWADAHRQGLVFVAFGHSLDAFEALLQRMLGVDDGICDALFRFTRPLTGSYFWCPPVVDGRFYLGAVEGRSS